MPRTPLQDLPVERFLPPPTDPNIPARPASPFKHPSSSHKRPLSPSAASVLFSPAKRRILAQEGLFSPPKSPLSGSSSGRFAPAYFHDLVRGPDSPARKLDFGPAKGTTSPTRGESSSSESSGPATPPPATARSRTSRASTATPTKRTRTSPRLASSPPTRSVASPSAVTPKIRSTRVISPSAKDEQTSQTIPLRTASPPPMLVPRELPLQPDPQSIHYPGFDVHLDTHIILPRASTRDKEKERERAGDFREEEKENVPPRRCPRQEAKKGAAAAKSGPEKKAKSPPSAKAGSPMPRRSARLSAGTPEARRRERRRMEEEDL